MNYATKLPPLDKRLAAQALGNVREAETVLTVAMMQLAPEHPLRARVKAAADEARAVKLALAEAEGLPGSALDVIWGAP